MHDDFGWQTPLGLGEGVNSAQFEAGASDFENEDTGLPQLFLGKGRGGRDLYMTTRTRTHPNSDD